MAERLITFTNDGLTFDVVDQGPLGGELIIALHGFPQTAESWAAVIPLLTDAGFRVLAPNQRGYSPDARPRGIDAYRIDRLAGDVLALADTAGAERFHVVGHDWGGGVAWFLASRHPDRVQTVSVATTPHPRAMFKAFRGTQAFRSWYMLVFRLPVIPEYLLLANDAAGLRRMMTAGRAPKAENSLRLMADPDTATAALNWYRAILRRNAPAIGHVDVPALYVWSDQDPAVGRPAAVGTAEWMRGPYQFEILEGGTHWIPEDRPAEFADFLIKHLRRHAGA